MKRSGFLQRLLLGDFALKSVYPFEQPEKELDVLPPAVVAAKARLKLSREKADAPGKNGRKPGSYEDVALRLTDMASRVFAMEAVSEFSAKLTENQELDAKLEAPAARAFNTACAWKILGGARRILGEKLPEPESPSADGDSPHKLISLEAAARHIRAAGTWVDPNKSLKQRIRLLIPIAAYYSFWYPAKWLWWGWWPRFRGFGRLGKHLRFAERSCRRLARQSFHGMLAHGAALEDREVFLFRLADIALELYAITAAVLHVRTVLRRGNPDAGNSEDLADVFCRASRRRVNLLFSSLWRAEDVPKRVLAHELMAGKFSWLEKR